MNSLFHSFMAGIIPEWNWEELWSATWQADAWENTVWVILLSSLIGIACGLVGNFLLLRRMALTGDAISHSVLPGIVIAYIVFGTLDSWAMILGAALAGVFAVFLIEYLHRKSRLKSDAATGVAFTTLFALGMLLIRRYADRAHLDVDCVLYGNLEFSVFDLVHTPFGEIPRGVIRMSVIALICILLLWIFYKELLLTSFDAACAKTMGVKSRWIHFGLMTATSIVVVASLEAVGAVLVVGMMIVPPATARLLADRLPKILWLTTALVIVAAIIGRHLAAWLNTPLAASTMVASGALFLLVWSGVLLKRLFR